MKFRPASVDEGLHSSLRGHVSATYSHLVHVFGEPHLDYDPKVLAHWSVVFEDGTYVSIYLWKEDSIPLNRHDWNVGGHSSAAVEYASKVLSDTPLPPGTNYAPPVRPRFVWTRQDEALHKACAAGDVLAVEAKIAAGANPNRRSHEIDGENTPLEVAIENGHYDVVKALLAIGVDVNARSRYRKTPLHTAAILSDERTVKLLLDNGADLSASDCLDQTPAKWARRFNKNEMADFIEAHGTPNRQTTAAIPG